jgi:hypothetical protein
VPSWNPAIIGQQGVAARSSGWAAWAGAGGGGIDWRSLSTPYNSHAGRLWTNSLLHLMDEVPGAQLP